MDLIQFNAHLLSVKRDHMIHTIKYRKFVKKIISLMDIPEVIFKFIFNYVGSSKFPTNLYYSQYKRYPMCSRLRLHSLPKSIEISHPQALEGTESQKTENESRVKRKASDLEQ